MDPGDYDTNTLLINNIASVSFRAYEPAFSASSSTFSAADVEKALRQDGHIVYADAARRGIWCFYLVGKEGSTIAQAAPPTLGATLEVCGYKLNCVDEGGFEPGSLSKARTNTNNPGNLLSGASPAGSTVEQATRSGQSPDSVLQQSCGGGLQNQDTKPESKGYSSVSVKETYSYFIKAALSSLSLAFCTRMGAIALNSRTSIVPAATLPVADCAIGKHIPRTTLAALRVYLTTAGSLVMSLTLSHVDGIVESAERFPTDPMAPNASVLLAPLGVFGTLQGPVDGLVGFDLRSPQSPETQIANLRREAEGSMARYRDDCLQLLKMRGIPLSILSKTSWVCVHSLRRTMSEQITDGRRTPRAVLGTGILCWPSALCFYKRSRSKLQTSRLQEGVGGAHPPSLDPLSLAKSWVLGAEERDSKLLKRQKDRDAAIAARADKEGPVQYSSVYSPLALRRQSNSNAPPVSGAMYPTPPDGVQNPAAAAQYLEGAVPSPANVASVTPAVVTDVDTVMQQAGPIGETFTGSWNGTEKRTAEPGYLEISGGMGNDIFGDNDITEADFNFFDDQPGSGDMDFSGTTQVNGGLDIGPSKLTAVSGRPAEGPIEAAVPTTTTAVAPVFAKPELRHARSSLVDQAGGDARPRKQAMVGIKREPSPFNPATVYKRVRASLQITPGIASTNTTPSKRGSVYEKLDFDLSVAVNNSKYQENGKFGYRWDAPSGQQKAASQLSMPTTGYLQRHGKNRERLKESPSKLGSLVARITGDLENSSIHQSPTKLDGVVSDEDAVSLVSDQDDSSCTSEEPSSPAKSIATRRRPDDDTISVALSLRDLENMGVPSPQVPVDLSRFANNEPLELPLAKYFTEPPPADLQAQLSDEDYVNTAQILTDQAACGILKLNTTSPESGFAGSRETRRNLPVYDRHCTQVLHSALPHSLSGACEARFRNLVDLQDIPPLAPPARIQPRPPGVVEQARPTLFQIQPPHFELRRHETRLSLLPSCIDFWESLGLGPSQGPKDAHAVCVFPEMKGLSDHVDNFLNRMRNVYESLKLGVFDRLPSSNLVTDGLLPYELDNSSTAIADSPGSLMPPPSSPVSDQMGRLSQALAAAAVERKNFVVFYTYAPSNPGSIVECCTAFQRLYELFKRILSDKRLSATNELVMQLVPMDMIASASALAIPPPADYVRLCMETYDRCTLCDGSMPSPAIILEQPLPRSIDFKFTGTPSTNVLHEHSCMHIAYAHSVDKRWVTAAWTDNRGLKQMNASYCLGRRGRPLTTPFAKVAQEIWENTQELISAWRVHWQIIITKCSPMDQHEIDIWAGFQQGEPKNPSVSLTLIAVDTEPSLHLIPPPPKVPLTSTSTFYTSPVSTPQGSVMSPDGNTPSATPMVNAVPTTPSAEPAPAESDPETMLVDITDTTWGTVLSHRLNNSASVIELTPALASGYLVKRGGTRVEDPPVVMEVNIMYTEGNPRMYEVLLREMLGYFRGLGSLARARGMVDRDTDVRPWHIAAAEKGAQVLYQLM